MNIVHVTPGAGKMFCGNCFRDNALVAALRKMGHHTLMVPLYLPLTLDEEDQSFGTPIFFSGINVYLEQKSAFFRRAPEWLHRLLASPKLLQLAAGRAARTRAADVGDLTLSMIRGEEGNQARELKELIEWLKTQGALDVVCLSNALLVGMVRQLKAELGVPVVCMLQGEDAFLDGLPDVQREITWKTLAERAAEADLLVAPSRYFADRMSSRLGIARNRIQVVSNGINLENYKLADARPNPPVLGFFARMCSEKGLDLVVDAYIDVKRRQSVPNLKLHVGGGMGPGDVEYVNGLRRKLASAGFESDVEFFPNLDRSEKQAFLRGISIFSVPARYSEAFGLYVIEALASGVPVVQPRVSAFPELIEATGGGLLCEAENPRSLADSIDELLRTPEKAEELGRAGARAVTERFSVERMAENMMAAWSGLKTVK
ncbi:MAG: glycosyltransferase family 4 protein [Verrucomicrobia bacterium]|nr:glycosyltransferase family 4 protein [Verrucomicrobiota bacterium]